MALIWPQYGCINSRLENILINLEIAKKWQKWQKAAKVAKVA